MVKQHDRSIFRKAWALYYDGFREMPRWGRVLWTLILIKLVIMFLVFKPFLMPNYLNSRYDTPVEKTNHVIKELTRKP